MTNIRAEQTQPRHAKHCEDIQLNKVRFSYRTAADMVAVPTMSLTIRSGTISCFPRSGSAEEQGGGFGINTLLKLLAGELLPASGTVQVPVQLKKVYVPPSPILFDGTLMYNLQFGDSLGADRDFIWEVCRHLGMSAHLIDQDDFDVGKNGEFLKFSDRVIVSITRALIHDVDLLLISSALDVLGESRGIKVLRFLKHYVEKQGLAFGLQQSTLSGRSPFSQELPRSLRHKKTVIYTSKFSMLQRQAQNHFEVRDRPMLSL